ncbi:MAG: hypothetical protein ACQEXJ_19875 [Myxococcota bacterium]
MQRTRREQTSPAAEPTPGAPGAERSRGRGDLRGVGYEEATARLSPEGRGAGLVDGETVREQVPEEVDLKQVRASFQLPPKTVLSGNWQRELRTRWATTVTLFVEEDRLLVGFSPSVYVDALWPVRNMHLVSAGWDFDGAKPTVDIRALSGLGAGLLDLSDTAADKITEILDEGIQGTPMARPGYDPFVDQDLMGTLQAVVDGFSRLPTAEGESPVGAEDLTSPSLGATLAMRGAFKREVDGSGVEVPSGGVFDLDVHADGDLAALSQVRDPVAAAEIAKIRAVTFRSEDVILLHDGEPIVKLERVRVDRGGAVHLEEFTLLGSGRTAAGVESLLRIVGGVLALGSRGVPAELGARATAASGNANPEIVHGMSKGMIEDAMADGLRKLLAENAAALPGVDLAAALGM